MTMILSVIVVCSNSRWVLFHRHCLQNDNYKNATTYHSKMVSSDRRRMCVVEPFFSSSECLAPSKVIAFSWRLLRDRLPTHLQLHRRGIKIANLQQSYVFCNEHQEDSNHLFLSYVHSHPRYSKRSYNGQAIILFYKPKPNNCLFSWGTVSEAPNTKSIGIYSVKLFDGAFGGCTT